MLRSLRFRLALLFAATLLIAAVIAGFASIRLYQSYNRSQVRRELKTQVQGVASYYQRAYEDVYVRKGRNAPPTPVTARQFRKIIGARIYYDGPPLFPQQPPSFAQGHIPVNEYKLGPGERVAFEFTPPGEKRPYLAVATPIVTSGQAIGAVAVAKPLADINNAWREVAGRVAVATGIGLIVAFLLSALVSRRITRPLRNIGDAADRVARGDLEVNVVGRGTHDDELGRLAMRFQGMVDRLREVDELERNFLMRVSHELRTPITAISGHVQALAEGLVGPDELEESLAAVGEEVRRLDRLVGDLLDLARLEAHRFRLVREEVGLEALLDQAAASFREKARTNDVEFAADTAGAPTVITDGDRVLQIVTNLLDNAFRWTPSGGTVALSCVVANGAATIEVADTGPGIARDDQEAVFHPFYSRRGEGGTGLGLAIARELAHALGGRLSVESELGRGATFRLALPREPESSHERRRAAAGKAR